MLKNDQIKTIVRRHHLTAGGISGPGLNHRYYHVFRDWLDKKYYGEMDWLLRVKEDRRDIRIKYPWVKSVLVVLDNYAGDTIVTPNGLKYSQYAAGKDYHGVMKNKLHSVFSSIREVAGNITGQIFVDSGPLLEKAFAEQAGLGWIGKNGLFIGKGIGSFCFIGVLLLSIELEPETPGRNLCGTCRKCIDACPNAAIVEPGLLNCERCISYLTVEKKSDFSADDALRVHDWVYGCDICQNVCPWNENRAEPGHDGDYHLYKTIIREYIEFENKKSPGKFSRIFENTPAARIGYKQMTRNVRAALKNVKHRKRIL